MSKPNDFDVFKQEFAAALARMGIDGTWDVRFRAKPRLKEQANVECDVDNRMVVVEFGHVDANYSPARLARHEAAHVLLADLVQCAGDRFANKAELHKAEETVATVLERVLP